MANPEHVALAQRYAAGESNLRLETLDLSGADLCGLDFSEAWLRDTNLSDAQLCRCRFVGASMPGTNFSRADLSEADLHGAIAAGAIFSLAKLINTSLRSADLYGAVLIKANLAGADLTQADLSLAQAEQAIFNQAKLTRAVLFSTNLTQADLRNSNLAEAENISNANFEGALLPADISRPTDHDAPGLPGDFLVRRNKAGTFRVCFLTAVQLLPKLKADSHLVTVQKQLRDFTRINAGEIAKLKMDSYLED